MERTQAQHTPPPAWDDPPPGHDPDPHIVDGLGAGFAVFLVVLVVTGVSSLMDDGGLSSKEQFARWDAVDATEEFETTLSRTLRVACASDPDTLQPEISQSVEDRLTRDLQRRLEDSPSELEELIVDGSQLTLRLGAPPRDGVPVTEVSGAYFIPQHRTYEWTTDTYEMRYQASCAAPGKLWSEGELPRPTTELSPPEASR